MTFAQGYAVVARRNHCDVLRSFHGSKEYAESVFRRTIDLDPLRVENVRVAHADNGNIRKWHLDAYLQQQAKRSEVYEGVKS